MPVFLETPVLEACGLIFKISECAADSNFYSVVSVILTVGRISIVWREIMCGWLLIWLSDAYISICW